MLAARVQAATAVEDALGVGGQGHPGDGVEQGLHGRGWIWQGRRVCRVEPYGTVRFQAGGDEKVCQCMQFGARSEEHTSELQSPCNLVCRLLLEKKKKKK